MRALHSPVESGPEITRSGSLSIQVIDAERGQVFYVNIVDFY